MKAAAKAAPGRGRPTALLQGLVAGAVAVLAPGTVLMASVLLAPGLTVAALNPAGHRSAARIMLLLGAAAGLAPMGDLWRNGGSMSDALGILARVAAPVTAWAAGLAGWLLLELSALAAGFFLEARAKSQAGALRKELAELAAEWSEPP